MAGRDCESVVTAAQAHGLISGVKFWSVKVTALAVNWWGQPWSCWSRGSRESVVGQSSWPGALEMHTCLTLFFSWFLQKLFVIMYSLLRQNWYTINCTYFKYAVWWALMHIYLNENTTVMKKMNVPTNPKSSHRPWWIHSSLPHYPQASSHLVSVSTD
jgi:hypothetical protein